MSDVAQQLWDGVDAYLAAQLVPRDAVLDAVLVANAAAGLPAIDVAPNQGKLLHLLAWIRGARRILEIGTLGGYSTIWLARALPEGGRLVTLEFEAKHAEVARANFVRAGLQDRIELREGAAADSLARLCEERAEPFDLIFIDADKPNCPLYLEWSLRLSRAGTVIVCDNVIREGKVADPECDDPRVQGVRRFIEMVGADPRLDGTALQTVGCKGYDGFVLALVTGIL